MSQRPVLPGAKERFETLMKCRRQVNWDSILFDRDLLQKSMQFYCQCTEWMSSVACRGKRLGRGGTWAGRGRERERERERKERKQERACVCLLTCICTCVWVMVIVAMHAYHSLFVLQSDVAQIT